MYVMHKHKGPTIRKVMGGGGGGGFSACTNFFFLTNNAFFEQGNLDSLSMFLCFINYSTLTTDQRIQATLIQNLFENVHTVREEWTASLCIFSVPALWNSSPTAHHNDAILHLPKQ